MQALHLQAMADQLNGSSRQRQPLLLRLLAAPLLLLMVLLLLAQPPHAAAQRAPQLKMPPGVLTSAEGKLFIQVHEEELSTERRGRARKEEIEGWEGEGESFPSSLPSSFSPSFLSLSPLKQHEGQTWMIFRDTEQTDKVFYHNPLTGQTEWEDPRLPKDGGCLASSL